MTHLPGHSCPLFTPSFFDFQAKLLSYNVKYSYASTGILSAIGGITLIKTNYFLKKRRKHSLLDLDLGRKGS